jgi:hypothetical protein
LGEAFQNAIALTTAFYKWSSTEITAFYEKKGFQRYTNFQANKNTRKISKNQFKQSSLLTQKLLSYRFKERSMSAVFLVTIKRS